jgi:hypothetical protein
VIISPNSINQLVYVMEMREVCFLLSRNRMFRYFDGGSGFSAIIINNKIAVLKTIRNMHSCPCCLLHAGFLLGLLISSEDGTSIDFQQTTQCYIPVTRSYTPLREPQILSVFICWIVEVRSIQVLR